MRRPQIEPAGFKAWTFWISLAIGLIGAAVEVLNAYGDQLGERGALALSALGFILALLRVIKQGGTQSGDGYFSGDRGRDRGDRGGHTPRSEQSGGSRPQS